MGSKNQEADDVELTLEKLKQFFEERPSLKPNSIGNEAGLSIGYMSKIMKEERIFTTNISNALLPILRKYGYGQQV